MELKNRNSINFLRIFAMILILLCHIVQEYDNLYIQMTAQILNIGVPIFIIISGYLYGNKEINEKYKTTIILTTHDLNDIEELCSRIIIIDSGKKIYDGEIYGVKEKFGYLTTVEIQIKEEINLESFNEFNEMKEDDEFKLDYKNNKLSITFNKNKISSVDIIGRIMKRLSVIDFVVKETSIEDIVKKMYRNEV